MKNGRFNSGEKDRLEFSRNKAGQHQSRTQQANGTGITKSKWNK